MNECTLNDLKLFKKWVKVVFDTRKEHPMTDKDCYYYCVKILEGTDIPDALKEKCKEYVIIEMEHGEK